MSSEMLLREIIDIPESVHKGDFKVELSAGFAETDQRLAEYVVTDQLRLAFGQALDIVRASMRDGASRAAYLHGSFGSGKSHFLTVLHAILNDSRRATRHKPALAPVVDPHEEWIAGKTFLMVPYHLIGAADVASAVLGGYVSAVRSQRPEASMPAVYRADAMLDDARGQRAFFADDTQFARWLGQRADAPAAAGLDDPDELPTLTADGTASASGWTTSTLDAAFAAPAGHPARDALVSALLSGPMASYARGATGEAAAFLPLEEGLQVMTRHAKAMGYDGLILFLDELILWLQSHMVNQEFVNTQVGSLVKLIASDNAGTPIPIVSFISRQRDLSQLVGEDVTGADVKNLEAQVGYLAERFDVISLEDRNLPAIVKERILKVKPGPGQAALDAAFERVASNNAATRDILLDAGGATEATWEEFREVYPLSPALLNALVALSGALQRERTGLRLLQDMLQRRRDDLRVGQLLPLGDLWDVLVDGTGEAFTDKLRRESLAAQRFHGRARAKLLEYYGSAEDQRFVADDRLVKTLLLAALTPDVPALSRLTGGRLAALNLGSLRSPVNSPGTVAVQRLQRLQGDLGELRSEGTEDPVFSLHLSDLDIEPLLDTVAEQDTTAARRRWVKDHLWQSFGVKDAGQFVCERDVVWRGSRRVAELVFANVRDPQELPTVQFEPSLPGRVRLILDYPFDSGEYTPGYDVQRVHEVRKTLSAPTAVWLPHFFSDSRMAQLGKLIRIRYLLVRDRLAEYAPQLTDDDRARVRQQLEAQRSILTSQLGAVLMQLYGLASPDPASIGVEVGSEGHVLKLQLGPPPRLQGGAGWEANLLAVTDGLYDGLYPTHPDFDPGNTRKALTPAEIRAVLQCISRAMEDRNRRVELERGQLVLVRKVAHGLDLGEVTDGPLVVSTEWRRRIDQHAAQLGAGGDLAVEDLRRWVGELGGEGLDPLLVNLIIATYALLADRAWVYHGGPGEQPALDKIGTGWALRPPDLPTESEFLAARERGQKLFGVKVADILFTRNVQSLADQVMHGVEEWEGPLSRLRQQLKEHAGDLGIDPEKSDRARSVRALAELLARLRQAGSGTELVRVLAYDAPDDGARSDGVLLETGGRAAALHRALEEMDWSQQDSLRSIAERVGEAGDRARVILGRLGKEAALAEKNQSLEAALRTARTEGWNLIQSLIVVTPPAPEPVPETRPDPSVVLPSVAPLPPAPASARAQIRASELEASLQAFLNRIRKDVEAEVRAHPGRNIDIQWNLIADHEAG